MQNTDVAIIGAGMTGLTAAVNLHRKGYKVLLLEKEAEAGGRIRSEKAGGFIFDRGFQVFLPAYPEAKQLLDYKALRLKYFQQGAVVHSPKGRSRLADPLRNPALFPASVLSSVGTTQDKIRLNSLRLALKKHSVSAIFSMKEMTTAQALQELGFSQNIIRRFFRPFLGGIFFDPQLETSSRMFLFVMKMFNEGGAAVPEFGMSEIPRQLQRQLPAGALQLNTHVAGITGRRVQTDTLGEVQARKILIATEPIAGLLPVLNFRMGNFRTATTLYFSAPKPPVCGAVLHLDGSGGLPLQQPEPMHKAGHINQMAVMSNVSAAYAPANQSLIALTTLTDTGLDSDKLANNALEHAQKGFRQAARTWKLQRIVRVPYGLPEQKKVQNHLDRSTCQLDDHIYRAGDYLMNGSLNAAMKAGRQAAGWIAEDLIAQAKP